MMAGFGALASSAASCTSNIRVRSTVLKMSMKWPFEDVSSETYGVQFDLTVDSNKDVAVNSRRTVTAEMFRSGSDRQQR